MVSFWLLYACPVGFLAVVFRFLCGFPSLSVACFILWRPYGLRLVFLWVARGCLGCLLPAPCFPFGFSASFQFRFGCVILSRWFSFGFPLVDVWFSLGFCRGSIWLPYAFFVRPSAPPTVSILSPFGFLIGVLCFPNGFH